MATNLLNDEQVANIGDIVSRSIGATIQTGWEAREDNVPYLYIKMGPNLKPKKYLFYSDGEVSVG